MDVALGVAITGEVARLALVAPAAAGNGVIDQSVVDLADNPVAILTETVAGTNRLLAEENHRLVATRLCWSDELKVEELRRALEDSGVNNVQALSESEAATALIGPAQGSAVLLVGDENATLLAPAVDDPDAPPTVLAAGPATGADATATFETMLARLSAEGGAAGEVYLVDTSSVPTTNIADQLRGEPTMRVQIAEDPTFALARGAAMAAAATVALGAAPAGDSTMAASAVQVGEATGLISPDELHTSAQQEPKLAYSEAGEFDEYPEFDEYDEEAVTGPVRLSPRSALIKNAVIAFAVIGFSSLAVAVAVTIRPAAASQPVQGHQNAQPGKFMPLLPTQQQAPVPAPPADEPTAGFQGGTVPAVTNPTPQQSSPGTPVAPVPTPAAPSVVPAPVPVPIPIPIPLPFPGWRPTVTETVTPTYTTPTPWPTTSPTHTPPTTTYTEPTTTHTAPTTTQPTETSTQHTTPPTTATQPPTTATQPPTTATQPTQTNSPTQQTTVAPQPTHTQASTQQTVAPKPVTPQQPANPQPTHGGGHH